MHLVHNTLNLAGSRFSLVIRAIDEILQNQRWYLLNDLRLFHSRAC